MATKTKKKTRATPLGAKQARAAAIAKQEREAKHAAKKPADDSGTPAALEDLAHECKVAKDEMRQRWIAAGLNVSWAAFAARERAYAKAGKKPEGELTTLDALARSATKARPAKGAKAPKPAKAAKAPKQPKPVKAKPPRDAKLGVLSAAAKLLAETGAALSCPEIIEQLAAKGLWTSPGGKTPAQTLAAAIGRELRTKGAESRFAKVERGKFAAKTA